MGHVAYRLFTYHLALKLLPVALLLNLFYILVYGNSATLVGNAESAAGQASLLLIFSAGLTSLASCWAGVHLRRTQLIHRIAPRSALSIFGVWVAPALLCGAVAQASGALGFLFLSGVLPTGSFFLILTSQLFALLFHTALGFSAGKTFKPLVAYPLAVLVSYVWLAFTWTLPVTFLRYLAGPAMVMCCSPVEHIDPAAPRALVAFSAIAGGGTLVLAMWRSLNSRIKAVGAVVFLAVGCTVGHGIAGQLGPVATHYLMDNELLCSGEKPAVCVGQVSLVQGDLREQISDDFKQLEALGFPSAQKAVIYRGENLPAFHEGTAYISYPPTLTVDGAHRMVTSIYVSSLEQCASEISNGKGAEAFVEFSDYSSIVQHWLNTYLAGASFDSPPGLASERGRSLSANLQAQDQGAQEDTVRELYASLSTCTLPQ